MSTTAAGASRIRARAVALAGVVAFVATVFVAGALPAPANAAAGDVVIPPGDLAITFVARVCSQYTDVTANRARNNLQESLRDLGSDTAYTAGQPISPTIEGPNQPNCSPLRNWNFQMGTSYVGKSPLTNYLSTVTNPFSTAITTAGPIAELNSAGADTGRMIDGAVTIVLTPEQALQAQVANSLWVQGGTTTAALPPSGEFGFAALRCGVDNLNGDNVEFVSYPQAARHMYCYYYAITPPPVAGTITVVKQLADGTLGSTPFTFEGNISYDRPTEGAVGRFTLTPTAPGAGGAARTTFVRGAVTGPAPPWNFRELVPGGWEITGTPACTTQLGSPWSYDPTTGMSVTLVAGDAVVCTFVNARQLTGPSFLSKGTINGIGAFPFTIDVPAPGNDVTTTVDVTAPNTLVPVASTPGNIPGTYTATETLPLVSYGTWELARVVCDTGDTVIDVLFTSNGQQRTASATIPIGGAYSCAFLNEFASDGAISIRKTSFGETGVFNYAIVPIIDLGSEFRAQAITTAPGVPVDAVAGSNSTPAVNLPIGSEWDVQEFLPAATAEGFWRVVTADCGSAGRADRPPDAVVRVRITELQPQVQCEFTNQFVSEASLEVTKTTSADTGLRPGEAVLEWSCDDQTSGELTVEPGATGDTTGPVVTQGFLGCSVIESQTGADELAQAVTTATIDVNGTSAAYTLGDTFQVQPEDVIVVTVHNELDPILAPTGLEFDTRIPLAVGFGIIAAGGAIAFAARPLRRRRG